jgi:hypothetical protein
MSSPYSSGGADFDRAVAGAHADYHREIQQHDEPDGLVDDVVTYQMLAPHLMRSLLFLVAPTVLLLIKVIIDYLASMSSPDDLTDVVSVLLGVVVVVLYLAGVASFFAPAKEPIAEHARLLENRGDAAAGAYEHVRLAAAARRSPAEVRPSTVAGVPVLLFEQYSERAMLLVQPYGRDLYVGWTMWRSRSTATLLLHFLRDTFGRFAPAPRFSAELRAAATRALRESVHSLSREGVAAALQAGGPEPETPYEPSRHEPRSEARSEPQRAEAPRETYAPQAHPEPSPPPHEERWPESEDPHPLGVLPTAPPAGPHVDARTAWTGEGHDGERVGVRREPDEDWGPPPRDRW